MELRIIYIMLNRVDTRQHNPEEVARISIPATAPGEPEMAWRVPAYGNPRILQPWHTNKCALIEKRDLGLRIRIWMTYH